VVFLKFDGSRFATDKREDHLCRVGDHVSPYR
jgi:hypothetical protein